MPHIQIVDDSAYVERLEVYQGEPDHVGVPCQYGKDYTGSHDECYQAAANEAKEFIKQSGEVPF